MVKIFLDDDGIYFGEVLGQSGLKNRGLGPEKLRVSAADRAGSVVKGKSHIHQFHI